MTEAKPLTDDDVIRGIKGYLCGDPKYADLTIADWYWHQLHKMFAIVERRDHIIADRDRIIAQAKLVAEQQGETLRELRSRIDNIGWPSGPQPPGSFEHQRSESSRSDSADYHDSLHADAMATEAEKLQSDFDKLLWCLRRMVGPNYKEISATITDIFAVGFTRRPRQLDTGKVAKWLHDNLGHHISAERIDNHYAPMLVAADIWK